MSPLSALERTTKRIFWTLAQARIPKGPAGLFDPHAAHSVLLLRPDRLGDFLLSAPAIRALEKSLPSKTKFTIVAGERNETVARLLFPKAQVRVFHKAALKRLPLFWGLWRGQYDVVIDLHSYPFSTTSALMAVLSGAPRRIGFWDDGEYKELSRKVFNFGTTPPAEELHESAKSLKLVGKLVPGAGKARAELLPFPAAPAEVARAVDSFFKELGVGKKTKVVAIHPTLQKADNRWSQQNYIDLIGFLTRTRDLKVLVIHGLGEDGELDRFKAGLDGKPNVFILPQGGVLFILEALRRCDALVCNDSGLAHLAAKVVRLVAIFGPSDPKRWGPLPMGRTEHLVLQAKDRQCDSVRPSEAARALGKIL